MFTQREWFGCAPGAPGAPGAQDVRRGEIVRVTGEVAEFNGLTELTEATSVETLGTAPTPVDVTFPVASRDMFERYEGMRVRFPQALVIAKRLNFDRFGEIVLAFPPGDLERPLPTSYVEQGSEATEIEQDLARRRITLHDGRTAQNPDPARHPNGAAFTLENRFRGGDIVEDATGVLSFGTYRLRPTQGGGFPTARGADTPEEIERQAAKIMSAIRGLGADVVELIEIENDPAGETSALDDLVDALNDRPGESTFAYVETGADGTDEIKVAFLYRLQAGAFRGTRRRVVIK